MTRGELTINIQTPIPDPEYPFVAEFLKHERMKKSCVDKILKDDPKFAEWFEANK